MIIALQYVPVNLGVYCMLLCMIFSCRNVESKVSDIRETEPVTYAREEENQRTLTMFSLHF